MDIKIKRLYNYFLNDLINCILYSNLDAGYKTIYVHI